MNWLRDYDNACCGSLMIIRFHFYLFTNVSRADVYTFAAPSHTISHAHRIIHPPKF